MDNNKAIEAYTTKIVDYMAKRMDMMGQILIAGVEIRTPVVTGRLQNAWTIRSTNEGLTLQVRNPLPYAHKPRYYKENIVERYPDPGPNEVVRTELDYAINKIQELITGELK